MAIQTIYRGIEYRSRLEARWASFFYNIGWRTTYEPFDGAGYIPDFIIHGETPLIVEVKPAVTYSNYRDATEKIERGLLGTYAYDVLIVGVDPLPSFSSFFCCPYAGLLGQYGNSGYGFLAGVEAKADYAWDTGIWALCECHAISVFHYSMSFASRPCGHYDGDNHLKYINIDKIKKAWADACNDVKWRGKVA